MLRQALAKLTTHATNNFNQSTAQGFKLGAPVVPVSYTHLDVYKRQLRALRAEFAQKALDSAATAAKTP